MRSPLALRNASAATSYCASHSSRSVSSTWRLPVSMTMRRAASTRAAQVGSAASMAISRAFSCAAWRSTMYA